MKENRLKRKILKDRELPLPDQISKYQDFNGLQKNYALLRKALLNKVLVWSAAVLGCAAVTAALLINGKADRQLSVQEEGSAKQTAVPCVQPPIPGAGVPFTVYKVSTKNGGILHYPTGSSVQIPANAFVGSRSDVLEDTIEIRYREFHTPLEIFLSGIPMEYDSAGLKRTFESAGMIEIRAFDKGQELDLKEGLSIEVKMASSNKDPRFNLYELDTVTHNWVDRGKDRILLPEKLSSVHTTRTADHSAFQEEQLIKPEALAQGKYSFKIAYEAAQFPELAVYNNVLFEVTGQNFKSSYYRVNWNKISLSPGTERGEYLIKLKKADTIISVTAKPVFDKENYAQALARFEQHQLEVSQLLEKKESRKQEKLNEVNRDLSKYARRDLQVALDAMASSSNRVLRVFGVRSLGYHNMDYPLPPEFTFALNLKGNVPDPKAKQPKDLSYSTIFLVEKGKNAVFRFAKGEVVKYNPKAQNLMWTMTGDNQIAFFRIRDYAALSRSAVNTIDPVVAKDQDLAFAEIRKFSEN